ncbi:sensor histidine kinase [Ammoniphilus sp. CFH 90114]|uniref:HAMP domain-containing sensor histidine kinase n=1 Tax=Ammoniphilus sp. CFH 90114 TaxID=2493665 RepID=UPI00100FE85B|nr:sensor histidine kinase [Ammoniphilus sp. CFH 90114]RXT08161.1 sensor histidine kinase [Ammoniphilus sp. CFH 90114]
MPGTEKKLTNIQWQFMRHAMWGSLGAATLGGLFFSLIWYQTEELVSLREWAYQAWEWSIPPFPGFLVISIMFIILWVVAIVIGSSFGYIYGNLLKKRIEILLHSAMKLERGNLTIRIPDLGDDEIGQLARQLNDMTIRFQQQVASLQRLSAHNAELTDQVKQAAIVEERQRLARELHDAVSQQLFAISMTMAALKRTLAQDPDKASRQAELVEEMAAAAQSEMRALLLHLRPAHLEGKMLRQGVEDLLRELQAKHSLAFHWSLEELPSMPKGMEDHLFRILQEALSNTLRHAKAQRVEIKLVVIENNLRLKITDDGIGFSLDKDRKASSYGMALMHERVAEIGGVLNISSAPGQGTLIEVTIPLIMGRGSEESVNEQND